MALLFVAQFIDRGLALLIPLQVAHMPGIEKIAATSGAIVSIGADRGDGLGQRRRAARARGARRAASC